MKKKSVLFLESYRTIIALYLILFQHLITTVFYSKSNITNVFFLRENFKKKMEILIMKLLYSVATDSLNPEFLDFLFISITFYIYPIYFVII